jgi:hypothetical protein
MRKNISFRDIEEDFQFPQVFHKRIVEEKEAYLIRG